MSRQFARFLLVGFLNTSVSYCVYASLVYLGLPYVSASLCAVIVGILFSFEMQGRFVFDNKDRSLLFRFAGCWVLIFVANTGFIFLLISLGLDEYAAGAVAMVPTALVSYSVQKFLVFRRSS